MGKVVYSSCVRNLRAGDLRSRYRKPNLSQNECIKKNELENYYSIACGRLYLFL